MSTEQAGTHTPSWEEFERLPVFVHDVFARVLILASGNVDASGDTSTVDVRHLVGLYCVVEVFVLLGVWSLVRSDLARHDGDVQRSAEVLKEYVGGMASSMCRKSSDVHVQVSWQRQYRGARVRVIMEHNSEASREGLLQY